MGAFDDLSQSRAQRLQQQQAARRNYNPANVRGANDFSSPIRQGSLPQVNLAMQRNAARQQQPTAYGVNHPLDIATRQQSVQPAPQNPGGWGRAAGGENFGHMAAHTPYGGFDGMANSLRGVSGGAMKQYGIASMQGRNQLGLDQDNDRVNRGIAGNMMRQGQEPGHFQQYVAGSNPSGQHAQSFEMAYNPASPMKPGGVMVAGGAPGSALPKLPTPPVPQVPRRPEPSMGVAGNANVAPDNPFIHLLGNQASLPPSLGQGAQQATGGNLLAQNAPFGIPHPNSMGPERPILPPIPQPPRVAVPQAGQQQGEKPMTLEDQELAAIEEEYQGMLRTPGGDLDAPARKRQAINALNANRLAAAKLAFEQGQQVKAADLERQRHEMEKRVADANIKAKEAETAGLTIGNSMDPVLRTAMRLAETGTVPLDLVQKLVSQRNAEKQQANPVSGLMGALSGFGRMFGVGQQAQPQMTANEADAYLGSQLGLSYGQVYPQDSTTRGGIEDVLNRFRTHGYDQQLSDPHSQMSQALAAKLRADYGDEELANAAQEPQPHWLWGKAQGEDLRRQQLRAAWAKAQANRLKIAIPEQPVRKPVTFSGPLMFD